MTRYPVDLYPTQDQQLKETVEKNALKRSRLLRECLILVFSNPKLLAQAVKNCQPTNYASRSR